MLVVVFYVDAKDSGADGKDCTFEWWEWTDNTFGISRTMPEKKWVEQSGRESSTFDDLNRHKKEHREEKFCKIGSRDKIKFSDSPKQNSFKSINRNLWIGFKVKPAPNCPCPKKSPLRLIMKQTLAPAAKSTFKRMKQFRKPDPGTPPNW